MSCEKETRNRFYIAEPYFSAIKTGKKTAEGRPADSRMVAETREGEIIEIWTCAGEKEYSLKSDSCLVQITKFCKYDSIEEMLQERGVANMLPDLANHPNAFQEAVKQYKGWRKHGGASENGKMVAVEIKVASL